MSTLIPENDYSAKILHAYLGYDNWGREAACLTLELVDAGPITGATVAWAGGFEGEWLERTVRSLRNCGFVGDDLGRLSSIVGKACSITVKHKVSKKGTVYLNVFINSRKTMEAPDATKFASAMRRAIASVDAGEDEPVAEAPAPRPPANAAPAKQAAPDRYVPADDEDVPF